MPDTEDRWDSRRPRRGDSRPEPRLEQRLDQWMSAGRQLVDGVAGTRPGSRGDGRSGGALRLNQVGRWVETKLDWLLEDDEAWRESWEEPDRARRQPEASRLTDSRPVQPSRSRRQPLQAISRRTAPVQAPSQTSAQSPAQPVQQPDPSQLQDWPEDDSFTVNRWSRTDQPARQPSPPDQAASRPVGRAVPRSSRRRFD
jgi:hypothetical protein